MNKNKKIIPLILILLICVTAFIIYYVSGRHSDVQDTVTTLEESKEPSSPAESIQADSEQMSQNSEAVTTESEGEGQSDGLVDADESQQVSEKPENDNSGGAQTDSSTKPAQQETKSSQQETKSSTKPAQQETKSETSPAQTEPFSIEQEEYELPFIPVG